LHESGLCRSPRLKKQAERRHEKAHVTWATKMPRVVTLFTLFSFVSDYKVAAPSYALSPNASYTDRMVSCVHELNKLYDGTMNTIVSCAFSTVALDMSNKEVFTYTKALQQPYADKFVEAMGKEVNDHKSRDHWEIVRRSTFLLGSRQSKQFGVSSASATPTGR
jgi:hypothetical protein